MSKNEVKESAIQAMRDSLKDEPEKLAEFEKAVLEGKVVSWGDADNADDVLAEDEYGTSVILIRETGTSAAFGLSVTDEGGFTGICLTLEQWNEMKTKIDKFLEVQ